MDEFILEEETGPHYLHAPVERGAKQPQELWDVLKMCHEYGPWVCGGATRRLYFEEELTSDIDVFCNNKIQYTAFCAWLEDQGATIYHDAKFNITYLLNGTLVQVIKKYFATICHVLNGFDFRMCQFGCDGQQIYYEEMAPTDVRNRVLVLANAKVNLPLYTLARITKYKEQGFSVPTSEVHEMLYTLSALARTQLANGDSELGYGDL